VDHVFLLGKQGTDACLPTDRTGYRLVVVSVPSKQFSVFGEYDTWLSALIPARTRPATWTGPEPPASVPSGLNARTIGDNVIATAQSGIPNDVEPNKIVSGYPAMANTDWFKCAAIYNAAAGNARRASQIGKAS